MSLNAIIHKFVLLFILLTVWLFATTASAGGIQSFKSFSANNPLSYESVRAIAEDPQGFMWFGTSDGLHRFDGYQLQSYHHDPKDPLSLSNDAISVIIVDSQGSLWIGTRGGGINQFSRYGNDFRRFDTQSGLLSILDDNVNTILESEPGLLWIGTERGLNLLRVDGDRYEMQVLSLDGLGISNTPVKIEHIIKTQQREVWVATEGYGISVFDLSGRFIRQERNALPEEPVSREIVAGLPSDHIKALHQSTQGIIWVGTGDQGLFRYVFAKKEYEPVALLTDAEASSKLVISGIHQDAEHRLWVATDRGAFIYNTRTQSSEQFLSSSLDPMSISSDLVMAVFEDSQQIIWLGTFSGVNRWDPRFTTFSSYQSKDYPVLKDNIVTSFAQFDDTHVVVATYSGGLVLVNEVTGALTAFSAHEALQDVRVMTLTASDNALWIGTRASGVLRYDHETKRIDHWKHHETDPFSLSADNVSDVIQDELGNIWVATFGGGLNLWLGDKGFKRFMADSSAAPETTISTNKLLQLAAGEGGSLWIATYGAGLDYFNPSTNEFAHFTTDTTDVNAISSDMAWTVFRDSQDDIWVGTQASGLNRLTAVKGAPPDDKAFEKLGTREGLKSNTVYGVTEDMRGQLWISSNKGVSRYSPDSNTFQHFDGQHGLIDIDFNHASIFTSQRGKVYFGSGKGFVSVDTKIDLLREAQPRTRLTNIYRLNEAILFNQSLDTIEALVFGHTDPLISFEYSGLDFSDPDNLNYQYRLEGFDDEWIQAGSLRRATYTNLPPGQYEFQVVAENNGFKGFPASIPVVIEPAPWKTWWAYLLYALVVALAMLGYFRSISRQLEREQALRESLNAEVIEHTKKFKIQNEALAKVNQQLENTATVDKLTGSKSRRYLDIYIEQTSHLMAQINQNIQIHERRLLPRLSIMLVKIVSLGQVSFNQVSSVHELLKYTCRDDDLVVRWSEDIFAIIGYEREDHAKQLAIRISDRALSAPNIDVRINIAFTFFPFDLEQANELSWDQVSVIAEVGLKLIDQTPSIDWLGVYEPQNRPLRYTDLLNVAGLHEAQQLVKIQFGSVMEAQQSA